MIRPYRTSLFLIFLGYLSAPAQTPAAFDLQGHRGCRGLMPENSLPAFFLAVELGVNTLELDVVMSADGQIIVSHEPWMSDILCNHPDGRPVSRREAKSLNLYRMKFMDIQAFDCGSRFVPEFPEQKALRVPKPMLKMVVRGVEQFAREKQYNLPKFNIEIKSTPAGDGRYHPPPDSFSHAIVDEIRRLGIEARTTIQSFDRRVLESLHRMEDRQFQIAYLVEKGKKTAAHLRRLSFSPDILSPKHTLVTEAMIRSCHAAGIRVIPWTVNDLTALSRLMALGVDGVITDYPDRIRPPAR